MHTVRLDPTPHTRKQVVSRLSEMLGQQTTPNWNTEYAHHEIDELLLGLINDQEITGLVNSLERWYA